MLPAMVRGLLGLKTNLNIHIECINKSIIKFVKVKVKTYIDIIYIFKNFKNKYLSLKKCICKP